MTLPVHPVPAPGFHKNPGAFPDKAGDVALRVQFACGYIDEKHTCKARDLRWSLTGHPWDVGAVRVA